MCLRRYVYNVMTDRDSKGLFTGFIRFFLTVLAAVFSLLLIIRKWLFAFGLKKSSKLPVPVVSVGNITVGGSGKTPLVEALASQALVRGKKVAIVTRGYMLKSQETSGVTSDEALMLKQNLASAHIIVGKNRLKEAQTFYQNQPVDIFILDDGFQHWRIERDLDIVVIDTTNPFGNHRLLPRGILREPLNALNRADCIVLTKTDRGKENISLIQEVLNKFNPAALVVESIHQPVALKNLLTDKSLDLTGLKDRGVFALSSIGDPASFADVLRGVGANVEEEIIYPDHYNYSEKDIKQIISRRRPRELTTFVTTAKDAVKLRKFCSMFPELVEFLVLHIKIDFVKNQDKLYARLDSLLHR